MVDRLREFTLSVRNLYLRSTFSDYYTTIFAEIIGPSGICYNFNMIEAHKLYKNLQNAPNFFRYNHDFAVGTMLRQYNLIAKHMRDDLNLTNPLSLTVGTSDFMFRFSENDKGMKFNLDEKMKIYDFYKFTPPIIYINNPNQIYSKDDTPYNNNPKIKTTYIVEPKQMIIDDNLKDSEPIS